MGKGWLTVLLLLGSNAFMTLAWYGHLKFGQWKPIQKGGLLALILLSWGLAFFEYLMQVPANKMGFKGNGGPFSLVQLKSSSGGNNLGGVLAILGLVFSRSTGKMEPWPCFGFFGAGCVFCLQRFLNFAGIYLLLG